MTTGQRVFLFLLAILAGVQVETMVMFLPPPVAQAVGLTVVAVAGCLLLPNARPWYLVAPVTFVIMLCPTWVKLAALSPR